MDIEETISGVVIVWGLLSPRSGDIADNIEDEGREVEMEKQQRLDNISTVVQVSQHILFDVWPVTVIIIILSSISGEMLLIFRRLQNNS